MPDGSKVYAKAVYSNPEKYFTDEFLAKLDAAAKKEYSYGSELDEELIPDTDVTGTDES